MDKHQARGVLIDALVRCSMQEAQGMAQLARDVEKCFDKAQDE